MLRANSRLRVEIGPQGVAFLEHATGAVNRILPHVEVSAWTEHATWRKPEAVWTSAERTELRMTVSIGAKEQGRSLVALVRRRAIPTQQNASRRALDLRELDICRRIAYQLSNVLAHVGPSVVVSVVTCLGIMAKSRVEKCRTVSCLLTDANGRVTRSWFVVPVAEGSNPSTHTRFR